MGNLKLSLIAIVATLALAAPSFAAASTKTLIGSIAGLAAMVAIFAIMSDCSKHVADVEANPKKACADAGGTWVNLGPPNQVGRCYGANK